MTAELVARPSGTVTFVFTDLVGSSRLWEQHREVMGDALARHDRLVRQAIEAHGGQEVKTTGDGVHAVFATARAAIAAAIGAQVAITREPWGATGPLKIRVGVHTGEAEYREGDYYGPAVNRAARLTSVAHGDQVVVSHATEAIVRDLLADEVALVDLGEHRLRDLSRPERVFGVVAPGLVARFPPLRSLGSYPTNLPLQLTSFVGRDDDLGLIETMLGEARLVTLTGVGGVGKTRLALHVAAEMVPSFPDGAWLCELAAANDADTMEQLVASTLGVQPSAGMSIGEAVREFLRTKALLLLLDNCEHLLEAVGGFVEDVLRTCTQVRILATSRQRLGAEGEQVQTIRPLGVPDPAADPPTVARAAAVRLFVDRARAVHPELALDPATTVAIADLCRHLDGVPLAIELAAARAASMSPVEITAALDERFRLLTGGRRTASDRQQTLRATADWSYSLLSPTEQLVFARLGTFPASFDAAAAAAVAAGDGAKSWGILDELSSLVDKSMVVADRVADGTTRYSMLETLRAYARERLDDACDADPRRRRHAEHYAAFAEEAGPKLRSADELAWRPRLRAELDNLRAAVNWSLDSPEAGNAEFALRIIAPFADDVTADAASHLGAWATRAVPRADETTPGRRTAVLGAAAIDATMYRRDHERARALVDEALRDGLPPDCPTPRVAYNALALAEAYSGRISEAVRVLRELMPELETRGDLFDVSANHSTISLYAWFAGDLATARAEAEEGLRVARQARSPRALALALFMQGRALSRTNPSEALAALEECVALVRAGAGMSILLAIALAEIGRLRAQAGDPLGAIRALAAAMARCRETGDQTSLVDSLARAFSPLAALHYPEPAAVIAGIVTRGPLAPLGVYNEDERDEQQRTLSELRAQLDPSSYEHALARGAAMSYEEVVAYALGQLDRILAETLAR